MSISGSLLELHPDLVMDLDEALTGKSASEIKAKSAIQAWWKCTLGHSFQTRVFSYIKQDKKCPICDNRKVLTGFNDLKTIHKEKSKLYSIKNVIPVEEITFNSSKECLWECSKGHYWTQRVYKYCENSLLCQFCENKKLWVGFNDLRSLYPLLADEFDKSKNAVLAAEVFHKDRTKYFWICSKGHEYFQGVDKRVLHGYGCYYCSNKKVLTGFNDLAVTNPKIASEWSDKNGELSPTDLVSGSHTKVWWKCKKDHEWTAMVNDRLSGYGCPICGRDRLVLGVNDLASSGKDYVSQWDYSKNDLNPKDVTIGSSQKAWWKCECGHEWKTTVGGRVRHGCKKCSKSGVSQGEKDVLEFISTIIENKVESSDRSLIPPKEIDIYIPEKKIAIEFNGIYWHTEKMGKHKSYHYDKWKACKDQGVQLIQVWEDDWIDKQEIVKSMLSHKLGASSDQVFYARKAELRVINFSESSSFLDLNHIQGKAVGSLYLGLFSEDKLVAVSVWRKMQDNLYLDRYATSCIVIGGMGKLLKAVVRNHCNEISQIVTFANLEVSDGNLYEKLGFTVDSLLKPDYSYLIRNRRVHKFNYRVKRFRDDPELKFEEGLTEKELAQLNQLERIWDSGKIRYILDVS